jgi:hypothetical protein
MEALIKPKAMDVILLRLYSIAHVEDDQELTTDYAC